MRKRQIDSVEDGTGAGEFLAFVLVVALSAVAFVFVGSGKPPPAARVVSMQDTLVLDESTTSAVTARDLQLTAVPVPSPRPE